jgi:hypothetical protein
LSALGAIKLGFSALVDNRYQQATKKPQKLAFHKISLKTPTKSHKMKLSNLTEIEVIYANFSI